MPDLLLVIDVQPSFNPPDWLVRGITAIVPTLPSIATVERHDETVTPFQRQLGWTPGPADEPLIPTDRLFVKHGYLPPPALIAQVIDQGADRVLVCGIQADTCCLAAGFALFDAGLQPTLLKWLTVGSSLDPSGGLGARLWQHHFGRDTVLYGPEDLATD